MPEEIKPDPKEAPTQDAQLAAENIASGEEKAPTVNMEADYKAAQKFSNSSGKTPSNRKESVTDSSPENQQPGNPADYTAMAKEIAQSQDK